MSRISICLQLGLTVEYIKCSFKMPITRLQSLQSNFFTEYDGKLDFSTIPRIKLKLLKKRKKKKRYGRTPPI